MVDSVACWSYAHHRQSALKSTPPQKIGRGTCLLEGGRVGEQVHGNARQSVLGGHAPLLDEDGQVLDGRARGGGAEAHGCVRRARRFASCGCRCMRMVGRDRDRDHRGWTWSQPARRGFRCCVCWAWERGCGHSINRVEGGYKQKGNPQAKTPTTSRCHGPHLQSNHGGGSPPPLHSQRDRKKNTSKEQSR